MGGVLVGIILEPLISHTCLIHFLCYSTPLSHPLSLTHPLSHTSRLTYTPSLTHTLTQKVDKWVILELSQVAKVDSIDISQNEPYTNLLAMFEVLGRQTHPRTDFPKEYASTLGAVEYGGALQGSGWQVLGR